MKKNNNLTLYIATSCPYCVRVTNFMAQKKLTDINIIDTYWDPLEHQRLKKQYGKSQVPLLLINDSPLYESLDIIKYLEEQYDIS
tara:strand:+ start:223 stop:477 length:255 start_codon:yes stop_codon:yes gene_type:complete